MLLLDSRETLTTDSLWDPQIDQRLAAEFVRLSPVGAGEQNNLLLAAASLLLSERPFYCIIAVPELHSGAGFDGSLNEAEPNDGCLQHLT